MLVNSPAEYALQPHEFIDRKERFAVLAALNSAAGNSSSVHNILPTVNALLSDYMHRLPARLEYDLGNKEWLANHSRFLCTDGMGDFGPLSNQLAVLAITQKQLAALDHQTVYLIPFLVEAAPLP